LRPALGGVEVQMTGDGGLQACGGDWHGFYGGEPVLIRARRVATLCDLFFEILDTR
jgi:hypothetical protein